MLGYIAILLAFFATAVSALLYLKTSLVSPGKASKKGRQAFGVSSLLLIIAAGYLYYLIFSNNFNFVYVFNYSAQEQAFMYKLSAFWGGQEGSLLIWLVFQSILGLRLAKQNTPIAMAAFSCLQLLLLVTLLGNSPFVQQTVAAGQDGRGLNVLLQDPWMAIHPPVVFLGYATLAVPFALALEGIFAKDSLRIIASMLGWSTLGGTALGAGIFIGSFWSYKVLGWGGYWAWDPVENAALVPWLTCCSLIHLLLLARTRKSAVKWGYLTAILTFGLILYGTYLTRSGILNDFSTHAFSDEGTGKLLFVTLIITTVGGLSALFLRWDKLPAGPLYDMMRNRDFYIVSAAVICGVMALIVFIGMSTPVVTLLLGNPQSLNIVFYNNICLPIATIMLIFIGVGTNFSFSSANNSRAYWLLGVAALLVGMVLAVVLKLSGTLPIITVGAAIAAILVTLQAMRRKIISSPAGLAHIGLSITLIGILFSSLAAKSEFVSFGINQRQEVLGMGITYLGKQNVGPDATVDRFMLDGATNSEVLSFSKRSTNGELPFHEPGIYRQFLADVYLAPVDKEQGIEELDITKGQTAALGDIKISFIRFGMEQNNDTGEIKAYSFLEVAKGEEKQELKPAVVQKNGRLSSQSDIAFGRYEITLLKFNLEKGQIMIAVKDNALSVKDNLSVQISKKPFVSLVWFGSFFVAAATLWSGAKRWRQAEN